MDFIQTVSDNIYGGLCIDLTVRCTNSIAIDLYRVSSVIAFAVGCVTVIRVSDPMGKTKRMLFFRSISLSSLI